MHTDAYKGVVWPTNCTNFHEAYSDVADNSAQPSSLPLTTLHSQLSTRRSSVLIMEN